MTDQIVGDHANPLLESQWQLCQHMIKWIKVVREASPNNLSYGPNWLPTDIDMLKSRLFWRIRSGQEPLPEPPPTCFSCPWYELIEIEGPHYCTYIHDGAEARLLGENRVSICHDVYEKVGDGLCKFGSWKFRYWQDEDDKWWIERIIPTEDQNDNAG